MIGVTAELTGPAMTPVANPTFEQRPSVTHEDQFRNGARQPAVPRANSAPVAQSSLVERFVHSPVAGFAPWIIYWVVSSNPSTWLYGALSAALTAIIVSVSAERGRLKMLNLVTTVFFAAVTIAGLQWGAKIGDWMDTYSTTLASAALAVMALGSLLFVPFTAQYARESTPLQVWDQAAFRHTNRILTLMWGLVFALIAVLGYVAVTAPATSGWTNWVIPIVLILVAVRISYTYPARVRARAARAA
jgi:hypothetical protein